jgi:hypothetical protein
MRSSSTTSLGAVANSWLMSPKEATPAARCICFCSSLAAAAAAVAWMQQEHLQRISIESVWAVQEKNMMQLCVDITTLHAQ